MSGHKTGETVTIDFTTASPTTGAAANADSLPTGSLVLNGTDNAATVTVTNKEVGVYKAAVTLPTVTDGDELQLRIAATVGGVAGKGVIWTGAGVTSRAADLATSIADIPTVAEFEARTLLAAAYFDASTDTVTVGTNNDKTGYSLTTAPLDAAGVRTAVGLAAANLDTQLADIPTVAEFNARTITSASYATATALATMQTDVSAILVDTGTTLPASIAALPNAAAINAEVVDALSTDTYAEPTAVPAATSSLKDKINWLFMLARNRRTQTSTTETVYADDGSTSRATSTKSDDGSTFTRSEYT